MMKNLKLSLSGLFCLLLFLFSSGLYAQESHTLNADAYQQVLDSEIGKSSIIGKYIIQKLEKDAKIYSVKKMGGGMFDFSIDNAMNKDQLDLMVKDIVANVSDELMAIKRDNNFTQTQLHDHIKMELLNY